MNASSIADLLTDRYLPGRPNDADAASFALRQAMLRNASTPAPAAPSGFIDPAYEIEIAGLIEIRRMDGAFPAPNVLDVLA